MLRYADVCSGNASSSTAVPLDKAAGDEHAHKTAGICEHTPAQEQEVRVLPRLLTHADVRTLTYADVC
jgi:hypothetical protein